MKDNAGKYYILNGKIHSADDQEQLNIRADNEVYEVIRVIRGVPLFFEDHFTRLENSLKLLKQSLFITMQDLKENINILLKAVGEQNLNVKLVVYTRSASQDTLLYVCKYYYPTREEAEKGVPVGLFQWNRANPNVKVVNNTYKELVAKKIEQDKVFEVLLVNDRNIVTEGSRSNVFFVNDSKVYTTPGQYVLKGITRQYILDTCSALGIEVVETLIDIHSLGEMEGLFISGTSIKVQPVSRVENRYYDSGCHPVIVSIREAFDKLIDEYVSKRSEAAR